MTREITLDEVRSIPDMTIEADTPPEQEADSWEPINLGHLGERPPIRPTLGEGGIAYPGKRHVFSGPQESAKTLAAYAIGLEEVRQGERIVVIDFEMGKWDARDRLQELGATKDDWDRIDYLEPDYPAQAEKIERLRNRNPVLVIIDAAAGAYDNEGLDDNKRQDVEKFTRLYVRDFWRAGIATIVLDHVVKNSETRGKYAIGSERKVGGADVHLGFEVIAPIQRGSTGIYKISTHKDRGGFLQRGRLADLHLTSDPTTHHITWNFKPADHPDDGERWLPTILMERVSEYLETQTEPVSFNQIVRNTKGTDSKIPNAIECLVDLKYATETAGTAGARLVSTLIPFRREEYENTHPTLPPRTSASPPRAEGSAPPRTSAPSTRGAEGSGADDRRGTSASAPDAQDQDLIDYYNSLEHPEPDNDNLPL